MGSRERAHAAAEVAKGRCGTPGQATSASAAMSVLKSVMPAIRRLIRIIAA